MAKMGSYCRAYKINILRQFPGWAEKAENARKEKTTLEGVEVEAPRQLGDDSFLYLQENLSVTDGIFLDENIIYDQVTPEWKEFCQEVLKFEVPNYESRTQAAVEGVSSSGGANSNGGVN
jgi:hypothetical protein